MLIDSKMKFEIGYIILIPCSPDILIPGILHPDSLLT